MKKLALLVSAALLSGGMASNAIAQQTYVGAKVGTTWIDDGCDQSSPCDDDTYGVGLYLGYDFSDYVALELGYNYLGEFKTNINKGGANYFSEQKLTALSLAPKFSLPLNEKFDLFAKIGGAYMDFGDDNDTVLTGGVGAEYSYTDNFAVRIEYQRFQNMTDYYVKDLDANFLSLGLTYRFGQSAPAVYQEPVVAEPKAVEPEPVKEMEPAPQPVTTTQMISESFNAELFSNNSSTLTPAAADSFKPLLNLLLTYPQAKAEIVGYTDSSGAASYNQKLSEKRAESVADYLISEGVDPQQVTASGKGENNPIASNATAEGRSENRRVEVTIPSFEHTETK